MQGYREAALRLAPVDGSPEVLGLFPSARIHLAVEQARSLIESASAAFLKGEPAGVFDRETAAVVLHSLSNPISLPSASVNFTGAAPTAPRTTSHGHVLGTPSGFKSPHRVGLAKRAQRIAQREGDNEIETVKAAAEDDEENEYEKAGVQEAVVRRG